MHRRLTLGLGLSLAAGLAAVAPAHAYQEAPALAKRVQAGQLPPLAQRLPEKPEVVKPHTRVGIYGGELRTAMRSSNDHNSILRIVGNQGLVRWSPDYNTIVPNVAEGWTQNADASEYVFKLRRGMKWSDGTPFTADDVIFAMNDLTLGGEFYVTPPASYLQGTQPVKVSKVDDEHVKFSFREPNLGFLEALALPVNQHPTLFQKKYCSQFHPKYNAKLDGLLSAENTKDWRQLMRNKCGDIEIPTRWANPARPTLDPWQIKEPYRGAATRVVLERNPYFWQVDTNGNQLPYIDSVRMPIISEVETILLVTLNGQLDFQHRHVYAVRNLPVLKENAAKGQYKVLGLPTLQANSVGLYLNFSTKNEALRKLIRNKDFRIALSTALDRKNINDTVFLGLGTPWQTGPIRQSKWYNEKLGTQYLAHDLAKANAMLDKLGLAKRDADGYRLYPDGQRVTIYANIAIQLEQQLAALELIRQQYSKVGIDLVIKAMERSLAAARTNSNDYDVVIDVVPGGLDITMNPRAVLAIHPTESRMSLPWVKWYMSQGKEGEEPSPSMKKRLALYDKWQKASSLQEADALFREILQLAADEFEVIGVVLPPASPAIRKNKLINVFDTMPAGWTYPTPAPALPQSWFFAK
ncbi:MAG: ABC transporter substrate-binding protein [Candidatus Dactylopiibacterium sp.]|nr:ABC transporter substrate-binding protein [Candidatus Dactylopiibacterium sp.]